MLRALARLLPLALLLATTAEAQQGNPSQVGQVTLTDCSATMTGSPVHVLSAAGTGQTPRRLKVIIQDVGAHSMGFSFTTATPTIGGLQTFTLVAGQPWNNDPDAVPVNDLWVTGTSGDVLTCSVAGL